MPPTMIRTLLASCASLQLLTVAACSDSPPPPQAAAQTATPSAPPAAALAEAKVQPPAAVVAALTHPAKPNLDEELAARVKKALDTGASTVAQGIDVSASGGKVRLWGTVSTRAARRAAEKSAAATPGVSSVENKIVVLRGS